VASRRRTWKRKGRSRPPTGNELTHNPVRDRVRFARDPQEGRRSGFNGLAPVFAEDRITGDVVAEGTVDNRNVVATAEQDACVGEMLNFELRSGEG
jgi:hypothetical protein